jgi:hypothetical protein
VADPRLDLLLERIQQLEAVVKAADELERLLDFYLGGGADHIDHPLAVYRKAREKLDG